MLAELRRLLEACPRDAGPEEYRAAVVEQNVLQKRTQITRQKAIEHLRKFYALDPGVLLFKALRDVWDADAEAQPLLALLCVVARDPLFRVTAPYILDLPRGLRTAGETARASGLR